MARPLTTSPRLRIPRRSPPRSRASPAWPPISPWTCTPTGGAPSWRPRPWQLKGPVVCDTNDPNPYSDPPPFYIYAKATGFYTRVYTCTKGQTITVDLDAVGDHDSAVAGVIFADQSFFAPSLLPTSADIAFSGQGLNMTLHVDADGHYALQNLPAGAYKLAFTQGGESFSFDLSAAQGVTYQDLHYMAPMQAGKPNIYLYPTTAADVAVTLGFPQGGAVTVSDPPYGSGWHVHVTPDGMIDGQHGFLFYEANIPQKLSLDAGWVVDGSDLEGELRGLLGKVGFVGREVDDFVEYWVPRLAGAPWYAVYPQNEDQLISLQVDPKPDTVIRALWLVRPLSEPLTIQEPAIGPVVRKGFVVTEWGVLKGI